MNWIKAIFKPFFTPELTRLESCEGELQQCRAEYHDLKKNYDSLAGAYRLKPKEVVKIPRDFKSKGDMQAWFSKNKINTLKYVTNTHDCDDFAIETQRAALEDGYLINLELDMTGSYYGNGEAHMLCGCHIGNWYYIIEPQTDRIVYETRLD